MKNLACRLCGSKLNFQFKGKILHKYEVSYYLCPNCKLLQTEKPYWLKEAYSQAIAAADTGIIKRNLYLQKVTSCFLIFFLNKNGKFLDYGGGSGIFTRLMRDKGFDFYWYDPRSEDLFARGFEYNKESNMKFEAITAFEVFEHLVNPKEILDFCFKDSLTDTLIFATQLYGKTPPSPTKWWYYSLSAGQHISFYNLETLKFLAKRYGLYLYSTESNFHLMIRKNSKMNNTMLKAFVKFSKYIYPFLKTKSKTLEDHQYMIKRK